jgi:hypothetical protein
VLIKRAGTTLRMDLYDLHAEQIKCSQSVSQHVTLSDCCNLFKKRSSLSYPYELRYLLIFKNDYVKYGMSKSLHERDSTH